MSEGVAVIGRRERNRAEKWARISHAAMTYFIEKGYDDTTLREIAETADVGFGTIFSFVRDKRDLLFSLVADDMARLVTQPFDDVDRAAPLADQLTTVLAAHYALLLQEPALWREALRQMSFEARGDEGRARLPDRRDVISRLSVLFSDAKESGLAAADLNCNLAAEALFHMFGGALRQWLRQPVPGFDEGVAHLRAMIDLQIRGFGARP